LPIIVPTIVTLAPTSGSRVAASITLPAILPVEPARSSCDEVTVIMISPAALAEIEDNRENITLTPEQDENTKRYLVVAL
jgi:hypothetical protein